MKAQSAIEFITAYSWALLLILVVGFIAFYYISVQQPSPQCDFGTELQCQSSQFVKNSSGSMRLLFQLNNGMGKAVTFIGNQTITVMNIGKSGVNSYNGSCWSKNPIIRGGDPIYCTFNINDSDIIPSLNRNVKFDVALNYVDCETAPNYPMDCYGGLNRTSHGAVTAPFEARPGGITSFCGDGICTGGEGCSNCTQDCGPCVVPTCQWSCAFGTVGTGICNSSCIGISGCSRFYQACNNYAPWTYQCSDSSGGTTGPLNYQVYCCNFDIFGIVPAPSCYSIDATHIGWCGNHVCDASHGENCSTCPLPQGDCPVCPSICLSNCTTGDSICHASCSPTSCSSFKQACDTWALGASRCSNSTGGTSGSLNNYTTCCNGVIKPALSCYQNTSETVGWCGDGNCAASRGETCGTCLQDCGACPINCQPDCTFSGFCNSTCSGTGGCSNPQPACNGMGSGAKTCSNSTGGITGITNYNVSCCSNGGQPLIPCGSNSTCPHTTAWCNGTTQNCSADTLFAPCNFSCANGVCGISCLPTCTPRCTTCLGGQTCSNGVCVTGCQPDCTFSGLCNSTCPSCSNVLLACNATLGAGAKTCSNSTGGITGITNYNVSCCSNGGQPLIPCGSNSTCPHTTAWCNGTTQNCSADTLPTSCNFSCTNGVCGTSCPATCTQTCTTCPGGQTCQGAGVCVLVGCQPDCTFGDNTCHASCSGSCSNFNLACDTFSNVSTQCSNSTGGTTGTLNYTASCCNSTPTSCGTTSCSADYCTGTYTICDFPSTCQKTCSAGSCNSCTCSCTSKECAAGCITSDCYNCGNNGGASSGTCPAGTKCCNCPACGGFICGAPTSMSCANICIQECG